MLHQAVQVVVFSILILSISNCSGTKKLQKEHETAAVSLMNHPDVAKFDNNSNEMDDSEYVSIVLKKNTLMAGWKTTLELNYDKNVKKWSGMYKTYQYPIRGGQEKEKREQWDNLVPLSGWPQLIEALLEHGIHSIQDAEELDYEHEYADGDNYRMHIRIGDKSRTYAQDNPRLYAKINPKIKDFADFAEIIKLLNVEFITPLNNSK